MQNLDSLRRRITELETAQAKHRQVETELQRRAALAELVHDVALRTSGALEPKELFPAIVSTIQDVLYFYSVALLLVDGSNGCLTLQAVAGHHTEVVPENLQVAVGEGMVGHAAETGKTQISGNVCQDSRYVRKVDSTAKSEMAVPIKHGEKIVGVLDIQSDVSDAFDEMTVGAMETLGTQIAILIENALLYEETRSRAERLAVVTHIAKAVGASLRLEELVETVYRQTAPIFQADTFFIAFYDETADELDFRFVIDEGARQRPGRSPLSATLSSVVVTEKRPLHIRDWEREKDQLTGGWFFGEGKRPRSWLGVPLVVGERVIGVLNVQSYRPNAYGEEEEKLLATIGDQIAVAIENARLFEETQGRAERLAVVNRIAKAVGASLKLDELMEIVYQEVTSAFDNDALYLSLYDEEHSELDFLFGVEGGQRLPRERIPLGGWSALIVKEKKLLHVRDYEHERDDLRLPEPVMWGDSTFYPSWLGVPMRLGDRVIGVITVMVNRTYAYSDEDERLLVTIADQVAVAIENARLFEETERRVAQLALVNDVGAKVAAVLELERMLERVVKLVYEGFGYDHVAFLTVDREREELVVKVRMGSLAGVLPVGHRIPFGKGLVGTVARSNKTLVVNDVRSEPRYDNPRPGVVNTQSELVVPVRVGDQTVGVIDLQSPKLNAFDASDVAVLETLAHQIAVAIENARLFEETRNRADRLALVNRISKASNSVLQLDDLMQHVYEEIASVFQVNTFFIALYDEASEQIDFRFMMDDGTRMTLEPQRLGSSLTSVVIIEKKPLMISNLEEAKRLQESMQMYGTMRLPASWLGVPLMIGDRVIGVVNVQAYRPYAFGEEDELLLSTIADQIAIATENARLYEAVSQELMERKRKEEKIRQLSQYLESVINNATVWLNVLDEEGNVVIWNKAAEAISGYSHDEVVGHAKIWEWLYPKKAYREEIVGIASEVICGDKAFTEDETTIHCKDGQTKIISWNDRSLLDEDGNAIGAIAIGRDVTAHKQAEAALQASEERFALAVQGANDGIWDWDIQNNTLYWSPHMKEMFGYADDELDVDFETLETFLHPDDKERTNAAIDAHLKDRVPYDVEQRLRTKSGEYRWYRARGQALWDESGKPLRMVGSTTDITELKRVEERLAKERNLLRAVIDNIPDTIYAKDANYAYTECNIAQACAAGVATPDQVIGKTDFDFHPEELAAEYRANDESVIRTGQPLLNCEESGEDPSGKQLWVLSSKVPLMDTAGRIVGLVGISRDITELREAEAKIQRYVAEIEGANEEIKQFAYIVSHDLRAPLVNLKGFAAELRSALQEISPVMEVALPTLDEERRQEINVAFREDIPEALGFIESSVTRMDSFISAVLKLSRLGRRELSLKSVDMNAVVEVARQSLAHQIEERHVNLTVTDLPEIVADQTSMEQIVGNLFANALLYLDPGRPGAIEIGGRRDKLATTFWVRDNGRGISEDDAPKVFAPFRRAGKQDVPGEGMGLSYVKTIVRMHGGHIWFESEPDVGTTFFFTIANDLAKGEKDDGQTRG